MTAPAPDAFAAGLRVDAYHEAADVVPYQFFSVGLVRYVRNPFCLLPPCGQEGGLAG